ncbi:MAG: hypothetical protein ACFFAQ_13590 [Promethearchaeota archaeon]
MNYKKLFLLGSIFLLSFPITNILAFTYVDNVKNGNYIFFLVDLDVDENIELNVTHVGSGNFTLFLFNKRPTNSYVRNDNTLIVKIFNASVAYNLDDNPYINYTAPVEKIYYIEIILISGGPDTFTLTCTHDLTRYYLPQIPGYQLPVLISSLIFVLGLIIILYKKKMKRV